MKNGSQPAHEQSAPSGALRFLVVDDNPDGRFLVSKTLLLKFLKAALTECQDAEVAFEIMEKEPVSLIICHRTREHDGVSLIRELRSRNATVPILMMSGIDRREPALAASASVFLTYDEWLMVGNHVTALLTSGRPPDNESSAPSVPPPR